MSIPLLLGALFLIGLAADLLGRKTPLPRVTLLLIGGLMVGPAGFGLLPATFIDQWFAPMTSIALALIGFLLGHQLSLVKLRKRGSQIIGITLCKVFLAWAAVTAALFLCGADPIIALLLGALAPATDPAATYDVIHESGTRGELAETLLGVVSLDDVVSLLLFAVVIAAVAMMTGSSPPQDALVGGLLEVGGSIVLGIGLGAPMAYLTGWVRPGETTLAEGLGFVLVASGLAEWLGMLPILTAMIMGITVASVSRRGKLLFDAIEGVEWPFMVLFFVLAGASVEPGYLASAGLLTAVYVLARSAGIYVGSRTGSRLVGRSTAVRRWLGLALLPQAGVAVGMGLLAAQRFPAAAQVVLTVIVTSTIILETVGPVFTRIALRKSG